MYLVMSLTSGGEHPAKRTSIRTSEDGPSLLVESVPMTLSDGVRVQFSAEYDDDNEPDELDNFCVDVFFYYDGVYYGDWVVEMHDGQTETPIMADHKKML